MASSYAPKVTATKSLSAQQNAEAKALLRKLRDRYDDQSALAHALGIKQGTLSGILSGNKGVGGKVLAGLGKIAPQELASIIGSSPAGPTDTLSMARAAVENLVRAGLATEDEARRIMWDVVPKETSVDGFYEEAKRRLRDAAAMDAAPPSEPPLAARGGIGRAADVTGKKKLRSAG